MAAKPAASFRGHAAAATIRQHMGAFGKGASEEAWRRLIFFTSQNRVRPAAVWRGPRRVRARFCANARGAGRVSRARLRRRDPAFWGRAGLMERV